MIAVAAPAGIVAALLALLFMLAWAQYGNTITRTLDVNLPIVGNVIGNLISEGLDATYAVLVYWFDSAITPITELIVRPIAAVENAMDAIRFMGANTFNAVWSIVNVRIPQAFASAVAHADAVGQELLADAQSLYNQAVSHADAVGQEVLADADQLYNQSIAFTQGTAAALLADAQSLYNQAVSHADTVGQEVLADADGLYNQSVAFTREAYDAATTYAGTLAVKAEGDLVAATLALEGYADQTATAISGALITDIDNAINATLGTIWTDVGSALADVEGIIATDDPDILAAIKAIPHAIPLDIVGVAALAGTTALTVARYLRDCGIPNCKNLSQFGKDLQGILAVVGDAAFLALLIDLVKHPSDGHTIIDSYAGGIIGDTVGLFRSAVGV